MSAGTTATAVPTMLASRQGYVPASERVLYDARPHPLFVVLRSAGWLLTLAMFAAALAWIASRSNSPLPDRAAWYPVWLMVVQLLWNTLEWAARRHVLTEQRVIRVAGVIRRYATEAKLERVQHVTVIRRLRERLCGLGTLGFATSGTAETEIFWVMVDRPLERLAMVRRAIESRAPEARPDTSEPVRPASAAAVGPQGHGEPIVIGLAGGIGSGKSEAARAFAALGCVVVDSDRESRAVLERPEVRQRLAEWWGSGVLRPDGTVDRAAVANIVFRDSAERERLEGLIHPLVRARRADVKERARRAGSPAVVVDAPLLFEAGVDRECDVVVFVDAPRRIRLERVRATRGWSEAELDRRERMQWPVEEKRQRADYVVVNDAGTGELMERVRQVFTRIQGRGGEGTGRRRPNGADSL